jgi:hypothetical protein
MTRETGSDSKTPLARLCGGVPLSFWVDKVFSSSLEGTTFTIRVNEESLRQHPARDVNTRETLGIRIQALPGATLEAVMVEVLWKHGLTFCVHEDHIEILKKADGRKRASNRDVPGVAVGRTTEVGAYEKTAPHSWGLCDMHGNVWQWCDGWYDGEKKLHILRGGSWNSSAADCRAAHRIGAPADRRGNDIGFRVCFRPE